MKLERLYYDVDNVVFGDTSYIEGSKLSLNRSELEQLAACAEFAEVTVDIAGPDSGVRILNIGDITQPTIRIDNEETTFPGVIGKMHTVGSGRSAVLRGIVISEVLQTTVEIPSMMQLSDEAAEITELARMWHVTIKADPAPGVVKYDYLAAINVASKKLAKYIASLTGGLEPNEIETFELERTAADGLPRVAYLANVFCHRPFTESLIYGASMLESLPTILHPNEILDGALTNRDYDNSVNADPTFVWQNHPIILELYRRHGVDLCFAGVVVNNIHHELEWKERNAIMASALLNNYLGAQAVITTKEGGGHPQVDIGIAVDTLEGRYGIKTAIVLVEMLSAMNDSYGQIIFKSDYADAMVSTGCAANVTLSGAARTIGTVWHDRMERSTTEDTGEMTVSHRTLKGGQSQLGWTQYGSLKF